MYPNEDNQFEKLTKTLQYHPLLQKIPEITTKHVNDDNKRPYGHVEALEYRHPFGNF